MTKVMGPIGILNGCQYYHQMTNEKPFSDWIILAIEISTVELLKIVHYDTDCLFILKDFPCYVLASIP